MKKYIVFQDFSRKIYGFPGSYVKTYQPRLTNFIISDIILHIKWHLTSTQLRLWLYGIKHIGRQSQPMTQGILYALKEKTLKSGFSRFRGSNSILFSRAFFWKQAFFQVFQGPWTPLFYLYRCTGKNYLFNDIVILNIKV